ncbi:MAG: hypothetical protein KAJ19_22630 [Gammaproteobacteria bacterium]|nr:hypothetical protein [Gammaproteobacteria bacterium]
MEPDYTEEADSPYALPVDRHTPLDLTLEEESLVEKLSLTEGQIRWKRMKVAELEQIKASGELIKTFPQEFPEDDVSCFITAGDMVYDPDVLTEKERYVSPPIATRDGFRIWKQPEGGMRYEVSVDPGQGKGTRSAITVWRFWWENEIEYGEICASLAEWIPTDRTAVKAKDIAKYYNRARIVPEANGHGLALIADLRDYTNLYRRKDIVSGKSTMSVGWLTTKKTKPVMIKEFYKMLPHLHIYDRDILVECRNLRFKDGQVVSIGLDDLHMAAAIGVVCRQGKPFTKGYVGSSGWRW